MWIETITAGGGAEGPVGPAGPAGNVGPPGPDGDVGPAGAIGPQGLQGIQGIPGTNGIQGIQGVPGNDGANGVDGAQGIQGIQGIQGVQGIQGIPGAAGGAPTVVEFNFPTALRSKSFTVVDAAILATSMISVAQAGEAATGQTADNAELDPWVGAAFPNPSGGSMTLFVNAIHGYLRGNYKAYYSIG